MVSHVASSTYYNKNKIEIGSLMRQNTSEKNLGREKCALIRQNTSERDLGREKCALNVSE